MLPVELNSPNVNSIFRIGLNKPESNAEIERETLRGEKKNNTK